MAVKRFKTSLLSQGRQYGLISGRGNLVPIALGGSVQDIGGFRIHSFSTAGSTIFTVLANPPFVEYVIVAGGGGGGAGLSGSYYGGGGGAGGYLSGIFQTSTNVYPVVVGNFGLYTNTNNTRGTSGQNSSIFEQTSFGGGGGAAQSSAALSGGSGGGGSVGATSGASGTTGQGFRGGNYNTGGQGAPGGSSSGAGPDNSTVAVAGLSNSISGFSVVYSRGGDGNPGGTGGAGSNNGNGGKGGRPVGGENGNNGVSGIVIIRYPLLDTLYD